MNPQGGPAEEANANIENNENDGSPQLSLESTLQRPLPLFPLPAESEQRFLDWFPQAQMNLPQQGPITGAPLHESSNVALVSNNSPSSSLIGIPQGFPNRPSNDVDLSLTLGLLGQEDANNVAPAHEVQEQGMNGNTSANVTLLPSKRRTGEFEFGGSSNMGEQASVAKRRVTESHVSANNNVNPSPSSLDLMQQPFGEGHHQHDVNPQNGAAPTPTPTPTPPQHHSRINRIASTFRRIVVQCPLHGQASSYLMSGPSMNNVSVSARNASHVTAPSYTQTVGDIMAPLHGGIMYTPQAGNDGVFVGPTPSSNIPHRFNPSEPLHLVTRYVDENGRVRNARGVFYHPLGDQNGSSSASAPPRQILNYSAIASSSGTRNYHNQVTIPALRPHVRLSSQELIIDHSLVLRALEHAGFPNPFDVVRPHRGLSVEVIMQHIKRENFVSTNKEDPNKEKCVICQEEYEDGDEIGKLDLCVHQFHVQCIKQWLVNKNACPICQRIALTMNNVENEAGAEVNNENVNA